MNTVKIKIGTTLRNPQASSNFTYAFIIKDVPPIENKITGYLLRDNHICFEFPVESTTIDSFAVIDTNKVPPYIQNFVDKNGYLVLKPIVEELKSWQISIINEFKAGKIVEKYNKNTDKWEKCNTIDALGNFVFDSNNNELDYRTRNKTVTRYMWVHRFSKDHYVSQLMSIEEAQQQYNDNYNNYMPLLWSKTEFEV